MITTYLEYDYRRKNKKIKFENFKQIIEWLDNIDNSKDKVNTDLLKKLNNAGISVRADKESSYYHFIRIEDEEGIHYDSNISMEKCSKQLESTIDDFISKVNVQKKILF